jgi:acetate kinase
LQKAESKLIDSQTLNAVLRALIRRLDRQYKIYKHQQYTSKKVRERAKRLNKSAKVLDKMVKQFKEVDKKNSKIK